MTSQEKEQDRADARQSRACHRGEQGNRPGDGPGPSELGIAVVIASRDEAKGRAAAETLKAEGKKNVEAVRFDVTRLEDHQEIARHLENRYGKLDILVNNAGVMLEENDFGEPGGFNTTPTVTPDLLRRTFETNFFAVVSLTPLGPLQ